MVFPLDNLGGKCAKIAEIADILEAKKGAVLGYPLNPSAPVDLLEAHFVGCGLL